MTVLIDHKMASSYPDMSFPAQRRCFHLDEDLLPDRGNYCHHAAYLNHGRAIARNAVGRWFAAVVSDRGLRGGNWLTLHISDRDDCAQGSQFPEPLFLFGPGGRDGEPLLGKINVEQAALVLDRAGRLHVVIESNGSLQRFTADASGPDARARLADKSAWTGPVSLMEDARLGDALADHLDALVIYAVHHGALFEVREGIAPVRVADEGIHPSVFFGDDGTTHVAFERDRRIYYAKCRGGRWSEPELVAHWCCSWPSLVVAGGRVVIVYQGEGKVELKRHPDLSHGLRPGGGSTISFARHDGTRWVHSDYLKSSQILLKRKISAGLPSHDEHFPAFMEEFWRPCLTLDRHGVAWMFFVNTTRRHVYWARWQGENFGIHHEARGAYDCMSRILLLQKDARHSESIGYMTHATRRFYFDAIPVPAIDVTAPRRIVFLDNLEVDRAINLEHHAGSWEKHPQPLFGHGLPGGADREQIMWCHVEPVEKGYTMHYMGRPSASANSLPGRAFSRDGLHWEVRPPVECQGLRVDGERVGAGFWHPVGLRDDAEADPQRRYKGLQRDWRYEEGGLVQIRAYKVVASPDGQTWHTVPDVPRVVIGDIVTVLQFLRDDEDPDPNRRYKIALCAGSHSGRGVAVFTSPDLLHWAKASALRINPDDLASPLSTFPTGPVVIDPDAAENPWEEEIHDAVLWREHGHLMFHYDAFYFGGNQHASKALAVSRDGRHYWRVLRGAVNLPHGACGDWDSGRVRSSLPVRVGDEQWMWFAGGPASDYNDPEADGNDYLARLRVHAGGPDDLQKFRALRAWRVGMARLRVEGWAFLRLHRDAEAGELTTIPFRTAGGERVTVNGVQLGEGGLRLELLDAGSHVVRDFARADCTFATPDSVNAEVRWRGGGLPAGTHRLRICFEGLRARLYAIGFGKGTTKGTP